MSGQRKCSDWLSSYLEYTSKQESPELFHLWCGISVLSAALGRKSWIDRGYYFTYPNHYIVLVSASALCKKSTAAAIATGIYNEVFKDNQAVSKKITLQKLMVNLDRICKAVGQAACFLFNSELSVLIGRGGNNELMDFLTDVYECPSNWTNETKGKGTDVLKNVFINFLGCTTPKDLASMPSTMIDGGFAGRTIFVYSDRPRPPIHNPMLLFDDQMVVTRRNLIADLREIATIVGEYKLTPEADEEFRIIYEKNYHNRDTDFRMHPYQGRKGEHLLKLATVIAASKRNETIIDTRDIKLANVFLEGVEKHMVDTFSDVAYSQSVSSKHADKFLQLVKKSGGEILHSKALNRLYHYMNKDEMKMLTATLEESGKINIRSDGRKTYYTLTKER